MDNTVLIIVSLTLVGMICGIAIFLVNRFLPEEDKLLKKTEEISKFLPGMNCGACGHPGCFAYAGEIAKDINILKTGPCMVLMNDDKKVKALGNALGVDLSSGDKKVAVVHCGGNSEILYEYKGIDTCKAAAQLSSGFKKCPYGCFGFGDCVTVCPENAISIDPEKKIVVIDPDKCIGCGLCTKECPQNLIEIIPAKMPQYLACNYLSKKNIPGRERCSLGCIHCRLCVKASENEEVTWNEEKDLPFFDPEKCVPSPAAIEKCPRKVIFKRDFENDTSENRK
jgi:H+/Na+-translocating ferredoxin:NAD+ oxidoreductase subunit B